MKSRKQHGGRHPASKAVLEPLEPRLMLSSVVVPGMGIMVSDDLFLAGEEYGSDVTASPAVVAPGPPLGQRPYGATLSDTSEYMLGGIYVNVVLFESDGSIDSNLENWTLAEIQQVKGEIEEGLGWWETTFQSLYPTQLLDFNIDFQYADNPFQTGYEPITRSSSDQYKWINEYLQSLGYATGSGGVRALNDAMRLANNTDWAYSVFVVDSSADVDGTFSNGYFAYAYLGGPFLMMTYDNGGWGTWNMGQVLAHESAHIFYALDEYYVAGYGGASYNSFSGYYNTQNVNAELDRPASAGPQVVSLMANAGLQNIAYANNISSPSSLEMIGWKDSDSDGIPDVLDQALTLTGSGSYNSASQTYTFSGSSSVQVLDNLNPRGAHHDITLNEVDVVQYRLDGGEWIDAGSYETFSANISLGLAGLPIEAATIEIRAISQESGASSNVYSATVNDGPAAGTDLLVMGRDLGTRAIDVLANDWDPEGGILTLSSVGQAAHGVTTRVGDTVYYTPNAGYTGQDTFEYVFRDEYQQTSVGQVMVTVAIPGDADLDGKVDSADLRLWLLNYDPLGAVAGTYQTGDFDGNTVVDSADLRIWLMNYSPLGDGQAPAQSPAPEPTLADATESVSGPVEIEIADQTDAVGENVVKAGNRHGTPSGRQVRGVSAEVLDGQRDPAVRPNQKQIARSRRNGPSSWSLTSGHRNTDVVDLLGSLRPIENPAT